MAIAVANSFINTPSGSCTVSGINAGELLVVVAAEFRDGGAAMGTPFDTGGNSYTQRQQNADNATFRSTCLIADCVVTTPPTSVSCTNANNIVVVRITGQDAVPFDTSNLSQSSSDDPPFPTVTAAAAGIVVVGLTHDQGDTSFDPPAGYTMAKELESTATNPIAVAYKIVAAGAQSGNWVTGGASDYSMVSGIYKEASAPTPQVIAWVKG